MIYLKGFCFKADFKKGLSYIENLDINYRQNVKNAFYGFKVCYQLGLAHLYGVGVEQDLFTTKDYFNKCIKYYDEHMVRKLGHHMVR